MNDFNIQEELPNEINLNLEDMVEKDTVQRRTEFVEEIKVESEQAIRESKEALNRYELSSVQDDDLLDQKIKDFVLSRNKDLSKNSGFKSSINGFRKKVYDTCKKLNIDLYLRDAKKILNSHLEKTESFKQDIIIPLQDKLYSQKGEKGLVVLLEQEQLIREKTANAISLAQKTRDKYLEEIAGASEELREIHLNMERGEGDYSNELIFLRNHINQTEKNKKHLELEMQGLEEHFIDLDYSIEEKEATILNAELVFKSGMRAYRTKAATLKRSLRLIQKNDISVKGLSKIANEINRMLGEGENIKEVEESFGDAFCETNRRIQDRLLNISSSSKTPEYISSLRQGKVEIEYELGKEVQERVNQYKTIA